jgi:hypothetical protein
MRNGYWWVFGFCSALTMIAVLQRLGFQPGGKDGWWIMPLLMAITGVNAINHTSR